MTRRPTIEHRTLKGPAGARERALRLAAQEMADRFVRALSVALNRQTGAFAIHVANALIRALTRIVEAKGDVGRATGILASAMSDVAPGYRPETLTARGEAEALFSGDAT